MYFLMIKSTFPLPILATPPHPVTLNQPKGKSGIYEEKIKIQVSILLDELWYNDVGTIDFFLIHEKFVEHLDDDNCWKSFYVNLS